ncbi:spondin domain-containing protein [sulfur-oxidizing endosymbiont of Gigantopelta aegis]|uniref:spondin domain-containing protein n=1 Tax=sulfur-oxidizing endosymbiont of Gigantopelta aegis TaxID=2794934 RepID=UPI0018DB6B1F|nr:spondin domain-containing protein [sulfur-oxidizing endosymbiont of Gigantopelta aegis]
MSFKLKSLSGTIKTSLLMMSLALPMAAQAKDISVKITNLTNGFYFTPLIVTAHNDDVNFYDLGEPASDALQAMAEGGNISGLVAEAEEENADVATNPAGGLLAPGKSATAVLKKLNHHNKYLSVAAMLLPTNDGFFAADGIKIPKRAGTYTYYLNAYDAGTEANDEIINGGGAPNSPGIPVAPGGDGGIGASGVTTEEANKTVHVHRGTLGDDIAEGGRSDLDSSIHTWLNPVVKMEITVSCNKRHYYGKGCR